MSENLLQFLWLHRLYATHKAMLTKDGEEIIVVHPGRWNKHAGPDFLEAKIKIGKTLWVGHVEIHVKSSDWNKHQHQMDQAYNKLILHVVYLDDASIETANKSHFPTLEIKAYIEQIHLARYEQLMQSKGFIPCQDYLQHISEIIILQQLDKMLVERLEEKTKHLLLLLSRNKNNWQEVFYLQLARSFGLHINQDAFEQLAIQTPLSILTKHKNNLFQLEAILFGQAGFLNDYFDQEYPIALQNEYTYLKNLYQLNPLEKCSWKFLRLRPANFPTIRIAQFAQLLYQSIHLFSSILEATSLKDILQLLHSSTSDYWLTHYTFSEQSFKKNKTLGKAFRELLIINTIVPILFIYGKLNGKEVYCSKAIDLLKSIRPEQNALIQKFQALSLIAQHAADSQAMIHLKNNYCDKKRCLECSIGYKLMK